MNNKANGDRKSQTLGMVQVALFAALDGQCCTYGSDHYRAGKYAARDDPASGD